MDFRPAIAAAIAAAILFGVYGGGYSIFYLGREPCERDILPCDFGRIRWPVSWQRGFLSRR